MIVLVSCLESVIGKETTAFVRIVYEKIFLHHTHTPEETSEA